jgi:hypothetical protein
MTFGLDHLVQPASTQAVAQPVVHFVTGRDEVLRLGRHLIEFSERCGQAGAMHDIAYFLSKPGALPRTPHLLLVSTVNDLDLRNPNLDDLVGLLLIFEQRVSGFGAGAFATNDRSGRSTLIAMPSRRSEVAAIATRALLDRGAHLILMSFRSEEEMGASNQTRTPLLTAAQGRVVARWSQRGRTIPGYLPLAATFDSTVAQIGQRTRSNLRYYRRRAESDLGCVFLPQIEASREDVVAFSRECMYAVSAEVVGWRYDSLKELSEPVFMGIRHRDGRWLSMVGGRRYLDRTEILWQLNREGFAAHSLGTVMRSYFIEHEIAHGCRRLYIEGGTPQPIKFSFVQENLIDLVVVRRTVVAKMMQAIAQRYISPDNELLHVLGAKDLEWLTC